jgi:DNA-binding LacI/PurR family transcriptional regulator
VSAQRQLGWTEPLAAAGVETTIVRESTHPADEMTIVRESTHPVAEAYPAPVRLEDTVAVAARELLQRPDRPTAILCFSDVTAYRVIRTAEELGLRVPQDLSVVGFDDSPLARRMHPALTTVRQDVRAKGQAAAAALTSAIEAAQSGKKPPRAKRVVLPTELVIRASTAPPPVG